MLGGVMNVARFVRLVLALVLVGTTSLVVTACGDSRPSKTAHIKPGEMPEGESWTGVYYHPIFGELHMQEEGTNIVGAWRRSDQSAWGELSGTFTGNVFHFTWKEHKTGGMGLTKAGTSHGKGYFIYKIDDEKRPVLKGEYGLNDEEVGSDWSCVKQTRRTPDLKSVRGDVDAVPPSSF
jgi:hypothetical protein